MIETYVIYKKCLSEMCLMLISLLKNLCNAYKSIGKRVMIYSHLINICYKTYLKRKKILYVCALSRNLS